MLEYDDLSPGQKKWVLMVNIFHPEIEDVITFDQVHTFHREFMELRKKDTKYKVGLPNWLLSSNRVDKALYFFPAEGNTYKAKERENDDQLVLIYQQHLLDAGLICKPDVVECV